MKTGYKLKGSESKHSEFVQTASFIFRRWRVKSEIVWTLFENNCIHKEGAKNSGVMSLPEA